MRLSDKKLCWCQSAAEFPAQYRHVSISLASLQLPLLFLHTTVINMEVQANSQHEGRPYRSHLHPACFSCRKRKSRCKTKRPAEVCVMCQAHGTECIFPHPDDPRPQRSSWPRKQASNTRSSRFMRGRNDALHRPTQSQSTRTAQRPIGSQTPAGLANPAEPPSGTTAGSYISGSKAEGFPHLIGIVAEADDDSSHIVSPAVADDNDILQSYLSATPSAQTRYLIRTSSKSDRHLGPVRFNAVPRRPLGVVANQSFAASKCELIEKYMEPDIDEYLNLCVYLGLLIAHYSIR